MDREFIDEEDSWTVISDDAGTKETNKDKDVGTQPISASDSASSDSNDKEPINSHKNDLDADEEIIKEKDTLKVPSTEIDEDSDGISIISAQNSDMEDNNKNPDDQDNENEKDDLKTAFECPKCEECKCHLQQALPETPPATPFEGDNQLEKLEENREITEIDTQIVEQNQLKINYWIVALVVAVLAAFMGTKVLSLRQAFELSSKIYEKQIIELKNENSMLLKQLEELKMSLHGKNTWDEYKLPEYCLNEDGSPSDQVVCEQKRRKFDMQYHKNLKIQQELRNQNQKPDLKKKRDDYRKQPSQFNRIDLDSLINVEPEPIKSYDEQLQEATDKLFEKLANKQFMDDEKDLMYSSTIQGDPIPDGITNDQIENKIKERSFEVKFNAGSQRKFVKIPADQDLDDLEVDIAAGDKELVVEDKEEAKPVRSQWTIEGDDQELSMENFNSEDFEKWNRKKLKNHENPYTEKPKKEGEKDKDKKDNRNFKKLEEFNRFEEGSGKKKKDEKFRKYEAEKFKKFEENPEKQWKKQDLNNNQKRKFDGNPVEGSKKGRKFDDSDESGEGAERQGKKFRKNDNKENQGKQRKFNGSSETFKKLDENVEKIKKLQENAARMKHQVHDNIRKMENEAEKFRKFDGNSEKFKNSKGDTDKNRRNDETNYKKFDKKQYEKQEKNENPGKFKKPQKSGEWHQNRMSSREESRLKADKGDNWYIERSREREIRRVDVTSNDGGKNSST